MRVTSSAALITSLKDMVNSCDELYDLMQNDTNLFKERDSDKIISSNERKSLLLNHISAITNEVSMLPTSKPDNDLIQNLELAAVSALPTEQEELHSILDQLKHSLPLCLEQVNINSRIITSTLNMMANLWEKLMNLNDNNFLYDNKGNASR